MKIFFAGALAALFFQSGASGRAEMLRLLRLLSGSLTESLKAQGLVIVVIVDLRS